MTVRFHSTITRYAERYETLSAFLLSPSPREADKESMTLSAECRMEGAPERFHLFYEEKENAVAASLDYEGEGLRFRRGATVADFVRAKESRFLLQTAYGALDVVAYTARLDVQKREGSLLLTLEYYANISGMVQKNTMKWKIDP